MTRQVEPEHNHPTGNFRVNPPQGPLSQDCPSGLASSHIAPWAPWHYLCPWQTRIRLVTSQLAGDMGFSQGVQGRERVLLIRQPPTMFLQG